MAKGMKLTGTRPPPMPSVSHADIDDWIRRTMPDLNPIVTAIDGLIRETTTGLHFAVKWKKAYYGLPDRGWIIEMVAYDVSVNVVFFAGAEFTPPPPLGEGRSRYVKIKTLEEVKAPELRGWVEQAVRAEGWK
jgi:hypothetical protein